MLQFNVMVSVVCRWQDEGTISGTDRDCGLRQDRQGAVHRVDVALLPQPIPAERIRNADL